MVRIIEDTCDFCGTCVGICPVDCIELKEADISIDHQVCIECDLCVIICPIEVLVSEVEHAERV